MATIKDFIVECNVYPYSQENYDLMKECSELEVTAKFIENQQFMAENAAMFSGSDIEFTEGYLAESVDQPTMDAVMVHFDEKVSNVMGKISAGFKKAVTAFINFFRKLINKFDANSKRAAAIKAYLKNEKAMDEGKISTLKGIANKAVSDSGFKVKANQPTLKEIKINYSSSDTDFSTMKNILAAGLSESTAIAEVSGTGNADTIGAVCAKTIVKACKGVSNAKGKDVVGIQSVLASSWKGSLKNGVPIYVKTSDLEDMVKTMEELKTAISELGRQNAEEENNSYATNLAENIKHMNGVYSSITGCIGKTMEVYVSYNRFRDQIITGMESYMKTHSGKALPGGKEEPGEKVHGKVIDKDGKTVVPEKTVGEIK